MHLLLIGRNEAASSLLANRLCRSGFRCHHAPTVDVARRKGLFDHARAVVLDLGDVATGSGATVRQVRLANFGNPLLVLSPQNDWRDRIQSLDAGADDFIVKPVRSEEIEARLRAILRRMAGSATDLVTCGGITLDLKGRSAWRDGEQMDLSPNEFRLLQIFLLNPNATHSHAEIWSQLYLRGRSFSANAIEVLVARLRRKIGHSAIKTVRGVGYRYSDIGDPDRIDPRGAGSNSASA